MNADREIFTFPVQLTTSRVGSLTRLIHTFAICVTICYTHIMKTGKILKVLEIVTYTFYVSPKYYQYSGGPYFIS